MQIKKALQRLLEEQPILVKNLTFEPDTIDHAKLKTGESLYWARNESGRWLSVDEASEEVILFEEVEEEVDTQDETVVFQNRDFEFSYEGEGTLVDEDGTELEQIRYKDYEADGEILRVVEAEVTGEQVVSLGQVVAETEIGEV